VEGEPRAAPSGEAGRLAERPVRGGLHRRDRLGTSLQAVRRPRLPGTGPIALLGVGSRAGRGARLERLARLRLHTELGTERATLDGGQADPPEPSRGRRRDRSSRAVRRRRAAARRIPPVRAGRHR
jgi:hypothetical protein